MLLACVVLLVVAICGAFCDDVTLEPQTVSEAAKDEITAATDGPSLMEATPSTESILTEFTAMPQAVTSIGNARSITRGPRRKGRRPRGYYNDFRYRNRDFNPYNPNSPFSFRGRPPAAAPPQAAAPGEYYDPNRGAYDNQYYDPYTQAYYGYPYGQPGYYGYPYPQPQPIPPQPVPPTPPPTEKIPDLYYVQKADSPDGQYEYKKVSVVQDNHGSYNRRARVTRWPQQPQAPVYPQGYYGYPYDPYNRRPPPPPQAYYNHPYYTYQQPQQPVQPAPQYVYPKMAGASRNRLRTGKPRPRPPVFSSLWSLTTDHATSFDRTEPPLTEGAAVTAVPVTEQVTQTSGD